MLGHQKGSATQMVVGLKAFRIDADLRNQNRLNAGKFRNNVKRIFHLLKSAQLNALKLRENKESSDVQIVHDSHATQNAKKKSFGMLALRGIRILHDHCLQSAFGCYKYKSFLHIGFVFSDDK